MEPVNRDQMETIVRECLGSLSLQIKSDTDNHGDPVVYVADPSQTPPRPIAAITDHRTERFSLRLIDTFVFQDFEYIEDEQPDIIRGFCGVVAAYLVGDGELGSTSKTLGLFGRTRPTYSVVVNDNLYQGEGEARPGR